MKRPDVSSPPFVFKDIWKALLPGVVLALYAAGLGLALFITYGHLERMAIGRFRQDVAIDADLLTYFLKERRDDLLALSNDRLILAYFENRALGMRPELGLSQSIYSAEKAMARFQRSKSFIDDSPIYRSVELLDKEGRPIIAVPGPGEKFSPSLLPDRHVSLMRHPKRGAVILVTAPCRLGTRTVGWIVAEMEWGEIFSRYLGRLQGEQPWPEITLAALTDNRNLAPAVFGPAGEGCSAAVALDPEGSLAMVSLASGVETIAVAEPIHRSPFYLVECVPKKAVTNIPNPKLLGGSILLFLLTILGWAAWSTRKGLEGLLLRHTVVRAETERQRAMELAHAKSQFLANMSHEIRTPLNGILGAIELMEEEALSPKAKLCLDMASRSGKRLIKIINDVLDLSRLEAGKVDIRRSDFDLYQLVEDVTDMFAPVVAKRGVEIFSLVEGPRWLQGDEGKIGQVLINLVGNAAKFTPTGWISITAGYSQGSLGLEISDTGPGIPKEQQKNIFEPFQQGEEHSQQGSGLGLNITKRLVELMGGTIRLQSGEARGTTFTVSIPASPGQGEDAPCQRDPGTGIVVARHPMLREYLARQLKAWKIPVEIASSTEDAVRLLGDLTSNEPRTVILDWRVMSAQAVDDLQRLLGPRDLLVAIHPYGQGAEAVSGARSISSPVRPSRLKQLIFMCADADDDRKTPEAVHSARAASVEDLSTLRVLVVEDNAINSTVVAMMLKRMGIEPSVVESGDEALERCLEERFHLILMDCRLPGMDGYETTRRIRAMEKEHGWAPATIVALTANALEGDRERCLACGMDDYLPKPVEFSRLQGLIARVIGDRKIR